MSAHPRFGPIAALALAVVTAAPARASVENFPFRYDITGGLSYSPIDVAAYSPIEINSPFPDYLYVVDGGANELLRYTLSDDGIVTSLTPSLWFQDPNGTTVVTAVACDDNSYSPTFGLVHLAVHDLNSGTWEVLTFDQTGFLGLVNVDWSGWKDISALAVDKHGDLYVVDAVAGTTSRYAASWFASNWNTALVITPAATVTPYSGAPTDVTVTESDLVLVADSNGFLMATDRFGNDVFVRSNGVPNIKSISIDAHDESERLWHLDPPGPATSSHAERLFFDSCYANNGVVRTLDGITPSGSSTSLVAPVRVEHTRFFDLVPSFNFPRCSERVFVADPGAGRVRTYGVITVNKQPSPAPVAWWKFDETGSTMLDSSGNSNLASFGWSTQPAREEGMVRHGLVFGTGDDGLTVPSSASLNFGTGSYTVECWVRSCDNVGVKNIVDKRLMSGSAAIDGYEMYLYNGSLAFQIASGSNWWNIGTNSFPAGYVADGKFHHVAAVVCKDPGIVWFNTITFYVDGQQVGPSVAIPSNVQGSVTNPAPLLIADHPVNTWQMSLAGEIDELTLYARILTPNQILRIFNARGAGKL